MKPIRTTAPPLIKPGTRFIVEDAQGRMHPGSVKDTKNQENPMLCNCIMDNGKLWSLDRQKVIAGRLVS